MQLAEFLEPIRGRCRAIVWFGEGLDHESEGPENTDGGVRQASVTPDDGTVVR